MEDDLNFLAKWKTTSILNKLKTTSILSFLKMEDDFNFEVNER